MEKRLLFPKCFELEWVQPAAATGAGAGVAGVEAGARFWRFLFTSTAEAFEAFA